MSLCWRSSIVPSAKKNTTSESIAELSAYIRNNSNITDKNIIITTENHFLINRIKEQIKDLFDISAKEEIIENLTPPNFPLSGAGVI